MKQYTEDEITEEVRRIYRNMHGEFKHMHITELMVEVATNTPESVRIKISAMYDAPPMNTQLLFPMCEFFETKHINDVDRWDKEGCETCNWGSSYGFELEVLP
jgi:hypothetical protein